MKSLIAAVILILSTSFPIHAQKSFPVFTPLLNSYYEMKNALVNSDASTASSKAKEFINTSNSIDMKNSQDDIINAYMALQKKLISYAEQLAATKDIAKQRDYFAGFSINFYSLAKLVKLSDQPIYQAYCPMKKMYWLTSEKSIQNPYYGKVMLTCGSITETINL